MTAICFKCGHPPHDGSCVNVAPQQPTAQPFTVVAGKIEGDGEHNYKYVESFADVMDAVRALDTCKGYHFAEIEYRAAPPAPVSRADERDAFEAKFPMPAQCIRCGAGYAATGYSAWDAHEYVQMWKGWKARALLAAQPGEDKRRLDWLETQVVNVRIPLRYGSSDLFWASPEDNDGDSLPSNIRTQIDAAIAKGEGS